MPAARAWASAAGALGQELDGIGDHELVGLIGQDHARVLGRVEVEGAQQHPLGAVDLLVHGDRRGAARVVHGVGGVGRPVGVLGPAGVDLPATALGQRRAPGGAVRAAAGESLVYCPLTRGSANNAKMQA